MITLYCMTKVMACYHYDNHSSEGHMARNRGDLQELQKTPQLPASQKRRASVLQPQRPESCQCDGELGREAGAAEGSSGGLQLLDVL